MRQQRFSRRGLLLSMASVSGAALFYPNITSAYVNGRASHFDLTKPDSPIINAQEQGLVPGLADDQSAIFQRLIDLASQRNAPLFLPAGVYKIANIKFPIRTRLVGVAGATRITYSGRGFLTRAERADIVHLSGIVFDGLGVQPDDKAQGLFTAETVRDLRIDRCDFLAAGLHGLDLTGCRGVVRDCHFDNARDTAIFAKQSNGLSIIGNTIRNCGNGGILVHRFTPGQDGSVVSGNRIENIRSDNGGTGQWGNGINVYQAHNVVVSDNIISNCAFSSVRANGAHNIQILTNHCSGSGETALYSEFTFLGAQIADNLIDGGTIGISLANFNDGGRLATVSGNLIRNLTNQLPYRDNSNFKPGIGIYAEADTVITSNVIENAPQAGIHIGWGEFCRNVIASQNIIRAVPYGVTASIVAGAGPVAIKDNLFSEISRQAITGFRWAEPGTGELLGSRRTGHDHLSISGNRVS